MRKPKQIRGQFLANSELLFGALYEMRGLDKHVPLDQAIYSSTSSELEQSAQKYLRGMFRTQYVKPIFSEDLLKKRLCASSLLHIGFETYFENDFQMNLYKLKYPSEYRLMVRFDTK